MQLNSAITALSKPAAVGSTNEPALADGAQTGSGRAEFRRMFDEASERDWHQLIRDVIALANSGGGEILVYRAADERMAEEFAQRATPIAAEDIVRRTAEFTGSSFADVATRAVEPSGVPALAILVGAAPFPIGFTKAGNYAAPGDPASRVEVFPAGSFYFRHGDNSEPGTQADLTAFFERLLRRVRRQWLRGIRRVVNAPMDAVLRPSSAASTSSPRVTVPPNLQPVRIVDDPNAPALQPQDVDRLYPYRQKDLVEELNRRFGRRAVNSYDIQAVRRHHHLDDRPDFVFRLFGAGRRYSPAVADWMAGQYAQDPEFFRRARAADQEMLKLRRKKPR